MKLKRLSKLIEPAIAKMLADAGFDTPRKIKAATAQQLLAIPGIESDSMRKIRRRFVGGIGDPRL